MNYANEHIVAALKAARKNKGLSQRELSSRAGVPQSHISKIESNAVDLRTSSLIALAHALDLELVIVPRIAVPAVMSIARSAGSRDAQARSKTTPTGQTELASDALAQQTDVFSSRPAYSLDEEEDNDG